MKKKKITDLASGLPHAGGTKGAETQLICFLSCTIYDGVTLSSWYNFSIKHIQEMNQC